MEIKRPDTRNSVEKNAPPTSSSAGRDETQLRADREKFAAACRDESGRNDQGRGQERPSANCETKISASAVFREAAGRLSGKTAEAARQNGENDAVAAGMAGVAVFGGVAATAEAGASRAAERIALPQDACERLLDRILVSLPRSDGGQEVRLRLDQQWLPDSEVKLVLQGGQLTVDFSALGAEASRFLEPRLPFLRERLRQRLGKPVTVTAPGGGEVEAAAGREGGGAGRE